MALLDWLQQRLTPVKAQDDRWVQLAAALEVLWREKFDPSLAKLEALRSVYEMSADDLQRRLREFGDYFAVDMPRFEDRKIGVSWRRLELEYKDLELILTSVFRRHYSDLVVNWVPLYAPKSVPYGFHFLAGDSISRDFLPESDYYMTSRGLLETDLGHLYSLGLTKASFLETAIPLVRRVKPLHIVFDGALFYIKFPVDWTKGTDMFALQGAEEEEHFPLWFGFATGRYDYTPADVQATDIGHVKVTYEQQGDFDLPFTSGRRLPWRLDIFQGEGHDEGWIPLDLTFPGVEGTTIPDLTLLYVETESSIFSIQFVAPSVEVYPSFDQIPADILPLDSF